MKVNDQGPRSKILSEGGGGGGGLKRQPGSFFLGGGQRHASLGKLGFLLLSDIRKWI